MDVQPNEMTKDMSKSNKTFIWDLPIRLFHWLLVILIAYSWYTMEIEEDLDKHFISGYCVLALILFRLVWGFVGTRHARFRTLFFSPGEIISYTKSLFSVPTKEYAGHNPLGSLSVMALLFFLAVQAGTGLFSNDEDYYFGPLSDYVSTKTSDLLTEIHHLNFNILLGFIVLHILAILYYQLIKKEKLLAAMFHGKKALQSENENSISHSKLWTALIVILLSAGAVYALVSFA